MIGKNGSIDQWDTDQKEGRSREKKVVGHTRCYLQIGAEKRQESPSGHGGFILDLRSRTTCSGRRRPNPIREIGGEDSEELR